MMNNLRLTTLGLCFALAAPAFSQSDGSGWNTSCSEDSCTVSAKLLSGDDNRLAATFLAIIPSDDSEVQVAVALPLGTALSAGVRLVTEVQTIDLPFEVCFPDGCRARGPIDDTSMAGLERVQSLDVRFFPYGQDSPVSLEMPLTGFGQAVDEARATLAQ